MGSNKKLVRSSCRQDSDRVRPSKDTRGSSYSVPVDSFLVDQDPHQLGDGQGRVGVVQLNGHLVRHFGEVAPGNVAHSELGVLEPVEKEPRVRAYVFGTNTFFVVLAGL